MEPSIFTRIINGEIPCHKIYEDEKTFAFLDIHPIQLGHVLVVPKLQVANFYELPDEDYIALFATVKSIAQLLKKAYPQKSKIGVMLEGLDVEHAHVKVFPFDTAAEYRFVPDMNAEPNHSELAAVAEKLNKELE